MSDVIVIDRLLARAVIGLNEWERRAKQDVLVSVKLWMDLKNVGFSDNVADTLNYGTLIRQLLAHVEGSERHTVESLATDVAGICLWWPVVQRVQARVTKPAADRFVKSVGVVMERTREQLLQCAYISLGSNMDAAANLSGAAVELRSIGEVGKKSGVYQTTAVEGIGADYLNAVCEVRTCLPAAEIRRRLKTIEQKMGRTPKGDQAGSIPIDMDLCLLDRQVIDSSDVRIPHRDILEKPYLAALLAELEPGLKHPITGDSMGEIEQRLMPRSNAKRRVDASL